MTAVVGLGRLAAAERELAAFAATAAGAGAWEGRDRERAIAALDGLARQVNVVRGRLLLAHEEQGAWGGVSDRDFTDWRARTTGSGRGAARGELELARGLAQLPDVARAVEAGEVGMEHAKALARVWHHSSPAVKKALAGGEMASLLEDAARLSAPQLAKKANRRAAAIDAAQAQADHDTVLARRSLRSFRSGRGQAWGVLPHRN